MFYDVETAAVRQTGIYQHNNRLPPEDQRQRFGGCIRFANQAEARLLPHHCTQGASQGVRTANHHHPKRPL